MPAISCADRLMAESDKAKTPLSLSLEYGELKQKISGDPAEVIKVMSEFFQRLMTLIGAPAGLNSELTGIAEFGLDGIPKITADTAKLGNKEKIALILYVKGPASLTSADIAEIYNRNFARTDSGIISSYFSTSLKGHTMIEKGADDKLRYRLTEGGRRWVKNEILDKRGE